MTNLIYQFYDSTLKSIDASFPSLCAFGLTNTMHLIHLCKWLIFSTNSTTQLLNQQTHLFHHFLHLVQQPKSKHWSSQAKKLHQSKLGKPYYIYWNFKCLKTGYQSVQITKSLHQRVISSSLCILINSLRDLISQKWRKKNFD